MEKKPVNFVVKNASEAAKRLNEFVEKGGHNFSIGVSTEYVTTVTKNSDGSKSETKEKRFRVMGMCDMYTGQELGSLNAVKEDLKNIKKEREEMNRTLNVMNKSSFAPLSILLLCVAIFTLTFGILTLAKVLPLPEGQIGIAVVLTIVGFLALGGSITAAVLRNKKKRALLAEKDKILNDNDALRTREAEIDNRVPQWYKDSLWTVEGNIIKNRSNRLEIK